MSIPARMGALKAFIFDVDGTLVATTGLGLEATNLVLAKRGLPPVTRAEYDEGSKYCTGERMARHAGQSLTMAETLGREYDTIELSLISSERCPLHAGVRELVTTLHQRGFKLAALSNGNTRTSSEKLRVNGIRDFFAIVAGADTCPAPKPRGDGVNMILGKCSCRASEAALIGDATADAGAANSAGVLALGAFWDEHAASERLLREPLFDAGFSSPAELLAFLDSLLSPDAKLYNADADGFYGQIPFLPHAAWPPGSTIDVQTGAGQVVKIPQVPETFNANGWMNEYQVGIGESTFGGLAVLAKQTNGALTYRNITNIALQRAKAAREVISIFDSLVQKYGYASTGESFSIADTKEVWMMELIGKGNYELGAVWVALRIPDGCVAAHANQARIRTFPRSDPANCLFSADVVSFARARGFYPPSAPDADFSFSDTYDPPTFQGVRYGELRVWSAFRRVAGTAAVAPYTDYAWGRNLTNRMPLWVAPARRLALSDAMALMRDHYEGTEFDFAREIGGGAFGLPYRWHPVSWALGGRTYVNERAIATQQTWAAVALQSRGALPREIGGVSWWAFDDPSCSVYVPCYGAALRVPAAFSGAADPFRADFAKAAWAFNLVANWAYGRWSAVFPEVAARVQKAQAQIVADAAAAEAEAATLYALQSPGAAVAYLTDFSAQTGDALTAEWFGFFQYLFARFLDGNVNDAATGLRSPGYSEEWRARIVAENGDKYVVPL